MLLKAEGLNKLTTERRNQRTFNLDQMPVESILLTMNEEDALVPQAIRTVIPQIESAVHLIVDSFNRGGRLIYMGAGTSGRLGVLDAAECVPTFGTPPEMVVGLIAGGQKAMTLAVEGAEDNVELGRQDLVQLDLSELDTVVGIAASGRTPYVIGGLDYARQIGANTIALACNLKARISQSAQVAIEVDVGPEVLTGSTRLKAGTVQKLVLNMLSTASMIKIGKVYQNLMIDINVTNEKLAERAIQIVIDLAQVDYKQAKQALQASKYQVKNAVVMLIKEVSYAQSIDLLNEANGFIYRIIES